MNGNRAKIVALISLVSFLCGSLSCLPPVTLMKGTVKCLKPEYQYFSLLSGYVWFDTQLIENFYRYGLSVEIREDNHRNIVYNQENADPVIRLLHKLFHVGVDEVFVHTTSRDRPEGFLTPQAVAFLIANVAVGNFTEDNKDALIRQFLAKFCGNDTSIFEEMSQRGKNNLSKDIKKLFNAIIGSHMLLSARPGIYPEFTIIFILQAFLCSKIGVAW